jgi:general secretion pathway protein G
VTGNRLPPAFAKGFGRAARLRVLVPHTRGRAGFTLIELLIVVTLIVVLAGIGLSTYSTSVTRAKEAVLLENLVRMRDAIDQYSADKGAYPPDLTALVTDHYIRQIPKDPFTDSTDTWQSVMSEPDPANPNAPPGVYDVKSGSQGTMLDGRPHSEL